jgi:ornithine carbamoyltransferase
MLGVHCHVASPAGYEIPNLVARQAANAARHGARLRLFTNPLDAVVGAQAVYSDVWTSMGQEAEAEARRDAFAPYQVNEALMARARPDAIFLHCLPAHRGEEVTSGVLDGPHSQVIPQAANRMHFQMALLLWLLGAGKP